MARWQLLFIVYCLIAMPLSGLAKEGHLPVNEFVEQVFSGQTPKVNKLWMNHDQRSRLTSILGHQVGMRKSYWIAGARTVWIFDEIGKELPITMGLVVEHGRLLRVEVLAFRESRGGEIRYPFFTRQYKGASLDGKGRLDKSIDGISGATMSVAAVNRAARAALYLDSLVKETAQ